MKKRIIMMTALSSMLLLGGCQSNQQSKVNHKSRVKRVSHSKKPKKLAHSQLYSKKVNYKKPSDDRPYPKKLSAKKDYILVSLKQQRADIIQKNGHVLLYSMVISSGSFNRTPKGVFHIQPERGNYFYSAKEHEGAQYYTSWKGHGVYLFHATPSNQKKQIYKGIANQLGKKPSSHGCIHLTIPDAKYIKTHAPVGMKVIIN